jgi:hypothetical protein
MAQCAVADAGVIPNLTSAYEAGDAEAFHKTAGVVIDFVRRCAGDNANHPDRALLEGLDLGSDYVVLAWPAVNQFSERTLYASLVHRGVPLHNRSLPGLTHAAGARLFQIFVAPSVLDRLAGVYVSEREPHPVAGQLPALASAVAGPLLTALAARQGTIDHRREALSAQEAAVAAPSWASVARVDLPFRRASIHTELRASVAPSVTAIEHEAEALGNRMAFLDVPHIPCAIELATGLAAVLSSLAGTCADSPRACTEAAHGQFLSKYRAQEPLCQGTTSADTRRNLVGLQRVDSAFRTYVGQLERTVLPATLDLENAPPSRFSLGVVTGYLPYARARDARVRMADGVITPDPLARRASLVVVNGAFRAYDATRFSPGWRERTRWFAGAVIAPDVGAGAGVSLLVVRGLALNVGGVMIVVRTPATGETVGRAPVDPSNPFGVGAVRAALIGLSYNFK